MTKVKLLYRVVSQHWSKGDVVDVPEETAKDLVARKVAVLFTKEQEAADKKAIEAEEARKKAEAEAEAARKAAEAEAARHAEAKAEQAARTPSGGATPPTGTPLTRQGTVEKKADEKSN